ncbi:amidohydrolase [Agrobacterium vitis]|uniref:Amidohydrolase n=2 Tax=Agrobacterium vitis TaxID=373 RepID=A0A6L6VHL1_AGRVI|nr:M20 aminoacylase family protein [Agrobacterium vitis]MUZ74501.1 amidohydrolase [Agrobacterium vitis]
MQAEVTEWRRFLHQYPELEYALHDTARFVQEKLVSFGINDVVTGIAETGLVALIQGELGDGPTIGLRADMDALPIHEASDKPWTSRRPGLMHGCGHDGHTAMLLGAAKYLSATRHFKGVVALIFQPAEEYGQGAQRMVHEGIMERFGISQVFSLHNWPGLDIGKFGICKGAISSALDEFDIEVIGDGGHAAKPHFTIDPIVIAAQIILGLQTLVSRKTDAQESLVLSVTKLEAGSSYNVIPDAVKISGTVRTLKAHLSQFAEQHILKCAQGIASAYDAEVRMNYRRLEPLMFNETNATELAVAAASALVGDKFVDSDVRPSMGSEDFAYMLEARPGAYIRIGNGPTVNVHNPHYDFNDDVLPYGIGYWVNLVELILNPSETGY